jgi:tRNA(Arg) A34 adenosine deaminase TadA
MNWLAELRVTLPDWIASMVAPGDRFPEDDDKVRLAVRLAEENVRRRTGGPFGAAVFEAATGRIMGVGVNLVTTQRNSCLHAEMVAFMVAQQAVGMHTLYLPDGPEHILATSCEPCAMCLGGVLWSGVRRVLSAATREDAVALGFDEGPVFPASYRYLEERGISFAEGIRRQEARAVMQRYLAQGGAVYNG